MATEWGVMQYNRPGLHRGPWTETEAREWVQEGIDAGFPDPMFYVVRREVSDWEPADG